MRKPEAVQSKIMTIEPLLHLIASRRLINFRIVFTNGCFDVLHKGHAHILNHASAVTDHTFLIVGLNSDASVTRLKGEGRPINQFDDRALMLASMHAVDAVVGFEEDTPYELIKMIRPDYLVKGGDYDPATIVGADIVKASGGEVVVIPYLENYSTTKLISKLAN